MNNIKIEVGDTVKCMPGFSNSVSSSNYAGRGYISGEEFIVKRIGVSFFAFKSIEVGNSKAVAFHALKVIRKDKEQDYEQY